MDLTEQAKLVDSIRESLKKYQGQKMHIRANMGRSKIIENDGVLLQLHPRLFIMEIHHKRKHISRQSYQYVDILTGTVKLSQDGKSLFKPFEIEPEPVPPLTKPTLSLDDFSTEEKLIL